MIYYTGIGSRSTPSSVLEDMYNFAACAAKLGCVLRSGAAAGADTAFEEGAVSRDGMVEIFLPWVGFNNHVSTLYPATPIARQLASKIHPRWTGLSPAAKSLIARNMHQVLGRSLRSPSDMVVCWTPDGAETAEECSRITGGTGSAIKVAYMHEIPVFNVAKSGRMEEALHYLTQLTSNKEI